MKNCLIVFFEFDYSEDEIKEMLSMLSSEEMSLLKKVYKEDLRAKKIKLEARENSKLNNLFTKMKRILNTNKEESLEKNEIESVVIDDSILEKIYIYFCEHDYVSKDELKKEGYSKEVIDTLLDKDILKVDNNLNYSLSETQVNNLFRLSNKKSSVGDNFISFLLIKKCCQLEPDNDAFKFLVFAKSISANQNIEEIMKYFDVLSRGNSKYQNDLNFYLLLLSYSYSLPKKYVDRLYSMSFNDIAYNGKNKLRTAVFLGRIPYAHKMVDLKLQEKGKSAYLVLTKYLLQLAVQNYYDRNLEVCNLLNEGKYQEIIEIYDNISNSRPLNSREFHERRLTKALVENVDLIPKENENNYNTWLEALDNDDIDAAYEIAGRKDCDKSKYLYLLLKKLNERKKCNIDETIIDTEVTCEQIVSVDNVIDTKKVVFGEVVTTIFNGKLRDILKTIYQYLNSHDKLSYFEMIVDYMKLCVLNNEQYYESILPLISNLETMSSKINIYDIVQKFYEALSVNQFSLANVYLQLIIDLKEAGICSLADSDINKIKLSRDKFCSKSSSVKELEDFEQEVNAFCSNSIVKTIKNIDCPAKVVPVEEKAVPTEQVVAFVPKKEVKHTKSASSEKVNITDNFDISRVLEKIKTISEDHIIILDSMNGKERKKVHNALRKRDDILTFSIGEGVNRSVVVKYQVPEIEEETFRNLIFEAHSLSKNGQYGGSLEKLFYLI